MDSKLVVEQMSGRWKIKHPDMRTIALQSRDAHDPTLITYTWVPRSLNAHADRLVNEALDLAARGQRWTPRQPRPVVDEAEIEPTPARALVGWAPDLGSPTTLILLRHGETPRTAEKRFSGAGDDPGLTDRGQAQSDLAAEELARGIDGVGIDAIVSSPLRRARETAMIAAAVLGRDVEEDEDLREAHFGAWDGLTYLQVQERFPDELAAWLASTRVAPPGGRKLRRCCPAGTWCARASRHPPWGTYRSHRQSTSPRSSCSFGPPSTHPSRRCSEWSSSRPRSRGVHGGRTVTRRCVFSMTRATCGEMPA